MKLGRKVDFQDPPMLIKHLIQKLLKPKQLEVLFTIILLFVF